jgi:hypothetical protein
MTATTGEAAVAAQSAVSMHVLQVTEARGKKARCDWHVGPDSHFKFSMFFKLQFLKFKTVASQCPKFTKLFVVTN